MVFRPKALLLAGVVFMSTNVQAGFLSWKEIEKRFKQENLNLKALGHVECFFKKHESTVFRKKISFAEGSENRCSGDPEITIDSKRVFALIDYVAPSDEQRMFLVDRQTGEISKMAVAHGRYMAGMFNTKLSENKNSIRLARYFSNEINSNAPSSGFFVAGIDYEGKFGRSLVLHGLEEGINDNACERAVVIHKHAMVSTSGANILSSGCPMINKSYLNHVINILKAPEDADGSVVFIYGPREAAWETSSCEGNFNI